MYNISSVILTVCCLLLCNYSNAQTSVQDRLDKIQTLLDNGSITQAEATQATNYAENSISATPVAGSKAIEKKTTEESARAAFTKANVDVASLKRDPKPGGEVKPNPDIKAWREGNTPEKYVRPDGN